MAFVSRCPPYAHRMHTVLFASRDRDIWDRFIASAPYGHILQSWEWGEIKAGSGWKPLRLALCEHGAMRGAAQILYKALPYGLGAFAYIPKGPAVDYKDPALTRAMIAALREVAAQHHVISLKLEPEVLEPSLTTAALECMGLHAAPPVQMRSSIWVDLSLSDDAILARMKQKTRYNIRLAARKGVTVAEGGKEDLAAWYQLFQRTAYRDGFTIHDLDYYRTVLATLQPRGMATLLLARHDDDLLAGIIVFAFGHLAQYMYGASSDLKRNLMAPYLVQWEGMRWAKSRGAAAYDLWGIPDRLEESDDLWGVYRHKRGYGGEIVRYIGAFDLIRAPLQHLALERIARPLFKRVSRRTARPLRPAWE